MPALQTSTAPSARRRISGRLPGAARPGRGAVLAAPPPTAAARAPPTPPAHSPSVDGRENNVVHRINEIRIDHGLRPLDVTAGLSRAADRHSLWQARSGRLGHQMPGERDLSSRLEHVSDGKVSEVVFWGSRGVRSADIVRAWMGSPSHRATLLSPAFSKAGVALRPGSGGQYATVDLAG